MFGTNQLYVFYHPQEIAMAIIEGVEVEEVDYAIAQKEIASNFCNVCYKSSDVSKGQFKLLKTWFWAFQVNYYKVTGIGKDFIFSRLKDLAFSYFFFEQFSCMYPRFT